MIRFLRCGIPPLPPLPQAYIKHSVSENTRRTYRSAVRAYLSWGGLLPTDEAELARYLNERAGHVKPETLSLHLSALSAWHTVQLFVDPTRSSIIRELLSDIRKGHSSKKERARPLRLEDLETIVAHLALQHGIKAIRDSALFQVGFFGAFRRSELVGIDVEHLHWEPQGLIISMSRSKTDQAGVDLDRIIPIGDECLCAVRALKRWLSEAEITTGPVFRAVSRNGVIATSALNPASVSEIIVAVATMAGIDEVSAFSAHSLRRGLAITARHFRADTAQIKRQGGWRDDRVIQDYLIESDLFTNNVASSIMLRKGKTAKP